MLLIVGCFWSEWQDLNLRPLVPNKVPLATARLPKARVAETGVHQNTPAAFQTTT
jgi:hypothetical protein